jgi:hypothetical protein
MHSKLGIVLTALALIPVSALRADPSGGSVDQRTAVPEIRAQNDAMRALREIYPHDFADHNAQHQLAFAHKLRENARAGHEGSAVAYVELTGARDLAAAGGDLDFAFGAIDDLADLFRADPIQMKLDVAAHGGAPASASCVYALIELSEEAEGAGLFPAAQRVANLALRLASRVGTPLLVGAARDQATDVTQKERDARAAEGARKRLEKSPDDADASLVLGRYLCMGNHWRDGLILLAKGADARLRSVAAQDLRCSAGTAAAGRLADDWWTLSETDRSIAPYIARARAAKWYRTVLPHLSGLARDRAAERILQSRADPEADAARDPDRWETLCWAESHWQVSSSPAMTTLAQGAGLLVTNATHVYSIAYFVLSDALAGDFDVTIRVKGDCTVSLTAADLKDRNFSCPPVADDAWHAFRLRREKGVLVAMEDGNVIALRSFNAEPAMPVLFGVLVPAGKQVDLREVTVR